MNSSKNNLKSKIIRYIYKEEYAKEMEEKLQKRKEAKRLKETEKDLSIKEIVLGVIALIVIVVLLFIRF